MEACNEQNNSNAYDLRHRSGGCALGLSPHAQVEPEQFVAGFCRMGDFLRCSPVTVVVGYSIRSEQLYGMVGSFPKRSLAGEENRYTLLRGLTHQASHGLPCGGPIEKRE